METPKKRLLLVLNGMQYSRQKKGGMQGQKRAVHSTQGGGGVTLIQEFDQYEDHKMPIKNTLNSNTSWIFLSVSSMNIIQLFFSKHLDQNIWNNFPILFYS